MYLFESRVTIVTSVEQILPYAHNNSLFKIK